MDHYWFITGPSWLSLDINWSSLSLFGQATMFQKAGLLLLQDISDRLETILHVSKHTFQLDFQQGRPYFLIYTLLSMFLHISLCRQTRYSSLQHVQHLRQRSTDSTPLNCSEILQPHTHTHTRIRLWNSKMHVWDGKQHYAMTTAGPALDVMSATVTGGFRASAGYRQAELSPWQDLSLGEKPPLSRRSGSLTSAPLRMLFTFRSWHPDKHRVLTGWPGLEAGIDMEDGGMEHLASACGSPGSDKNWRSEAQTFWPQGYMRLAVCCIW